LFVLSGSAASEWKAKARASARCAGLRAVCRKPSLRQKNWYDVWFPNLAPSLEAMKLAHEARTPADWAAFFKKYRAEMATPENSHAIELLAALSHQSNFSVGCYCENEAHCHRSALRELLAEKGAKLEE